MPLSQPSVSFPDARSSNRGHSAPAGYGRRWIRSGLLALPVALVIGLLFLGCRADGQPHAPDETAGGGTTVGADTTDTSSVYTRVPPSRNGIGKVYMGREISKVMGHRGAAWLERDERDDNERPSLVVDSMNLASDDVVADIGAGTGYFTFRIAPRISDGRVFAVDIQPEMLDIMRNRMRAEGVENVTLVRGSVTDPSLPADSIDAALMVDAYHEFSHPREMMRNLVEALTPGGRVYLVEYRKEDPSVPIKPLHKMSEAQARKEMEAVGLEWVATQDMLPRQHFLIFEKPAGDR